MENNIIDLGKVNVPTSWDEVTLKQFEQLAKLEDDKSVNEIIKILTGLTDEQLNELPLQFVEEISAHLAFLSLQPTKEVKNEVIIDNVKYSINYMDKLKYGEYVELNNIIDADPYNYSAMLTILCRQEGELYNDYFIANKFKDRVKMFNNTSVNQILPLIAFFLNLYIQSEQHSQNSLTERVQETNLLLKDTENLLKATIIRKPSMIWQMIKLRKLKKFLKNI